MKKKNQSTSSYLSADDLKKLIGITVLFLAALLIVIIMLTAHLQQSTPDNAPAAGTLGGLMSSDGLLAPTPVTSSELKREYEAREEITLDTQMSIDTAVTKYLTWGDFAGLDEFLSQQQQQYKNLEGEEGQSVDDWKTKFSLLRADITATMNLSTASNPVDILRCYGSPQVLAAAIAYAPTSTKLYAFEDWSSLVMPAVAAGTDIHLSLVQLDSAGQLMAEFNSTSNIKYIDLRAYDMTLWGYQFRLFVVADEYGYYRPYTLQNLDGFMTTGMTRKELDALQANLDFYVSLDDAYAVPALDPNYVSELKRDHPDYFDADGIFTGAAVDSPAPEPVASNAPIPVQDQTLNEPVENIPAAS